MEDRIKKKAVVLGERISLEDFIDVARCSANIIFSQEYCDRVRKNRKLVEQWVEEGRIMYGVTTGFGTLCTQAIDKDETEKLQKNIILTHAVSVGTPLKEEAVRGIMFLVLQNLGKGFSGVRLEVLEQYREFLNRGITPVVPSDGSVGYLALEAHIALVLMGLGKAWYQGKLYKGAEALKLAGLKPLKLSSKEGLALVSGTTSPTALGALALYDLLKAAKTADIIGALTLETLKGSMDAFDDRVMRVRPHMEQRKTAENVRNILKDSGVMKKYKGSKVQDALSLRCIPQLHGAVKKTLEDARRTFEIEINSCCDNPIVWDKEGEEAVISACNADSSYVGLEMDSASIAACTLGKMSERRNNRIIDENLSGYPWFCISNPGLNSGLMIPQYTQAGLLNEMRVLASPAVIDNTPTCGNQEDYVAMGYAACKKAGIIAEKLEYILAIELLSDYEAQQFQDKDVKISSVSCAIYNKLQEDIPMMENDMLLYPHLEDLKDRIHRGEILEIAEKIVGKIQ